MQKEKKKSHDGIIFGSVRESEMKLYNFKEGHSIKTVKNKSKVRNV